MFGNEAQLKSMPYAINDANDTILLKAVFERVTDQVLNYKQQA